MKNLRQTREKDTIMDNSNSHLQKKQWGYVHRIKQTQNWKEPCEPSSSTLYPVPDQSRGSMTNAYIASV